MFLKKKKIVRGRTHACKQIIISNLGRCISTQPPPRASQKKNVLTQPKKRYSTTHRVISYQGRKTMSFFGTSPRAPARGRVLKNSRFEPAVRILLFEKTSPKRIVFRGEKINTSRATVKAVTVPHTISLTSSHSTSTWRSASFLSGLRVILSFGPLILRKIAC